MTFSSGGLMYQSPQPKKPAISETNVFSTVCSISTQLMLAGHDAECASASARTIVRNAIEAAVDEIDWDKVRESWRAE